VEQRGDLVDVADGANEQHGSVAAPAALSGSQAPLRHRRRIDRGSPRVDERWRARCDPTAGRFPNDHGGTPRGPSSAWSALVPRAPPCSLAVVMPPPRTTQPLGSQARDAARSPDSERVDAYFSADVETDGPIPGPFSMLSLALVYAGRYDGRRFERPQNYDRTLYLELRPISEEFQAEALRVNKLDRDRLLTEGRDPASAMTDASAWVRSIAGGDRPILVAYPLSFDWSWLYWYFVRFSRQGSPFSHSGCFDMKTAFAVKGRLPVSASGRSGLFPSLQSSRPHTHNALDDAIEQAEIFANLFEWSGGHG